MIRLLCWSLLVFCSWRCVADLSAIPAYARFTHLTERQPISPFATSMVQDNQGFIWLGTHHGLYRFDGVTLQHYPADSSNPNRLSSDWITSLLIDNQGMLWVGTRYGGLNRLDPVTEQFRRYPWPDGHGSNEITALALDQDGQLWVSGYGAGVARLTAANTQLVAFMPEQLAEFRYINHLLVHNDNLYLALGEAPQRRPGNDFAGLVRVQLASGQLTHWHQHNSALTLDHLTRLRWLPSGQLAAASFGAGLWLLQADDSLQRFAAPAELQRSQLTDILADKQGGLWLSTYDSGVWHYQSASGIWRHFSYEPLLRYGLQTNAILAMYLDNADSLWFVSQTGFSQLSAFARQVKVLPAVADKDGLLGSNDVFGIDAVAPDRIWLANRESGVARYNPQSGELLKWPLPQPATGIAPSLARVVKQLDDTLWLGTDHGLFRLMPDQQWQPFALPVPRQPHISAIYRDSRQRIWLASRTDGVFVMDNHWQLLAHFHPENPAYTLPFHVVTVLYEDQFGDIWLGSVDQGLARISASFDTIQHWHQAMPAGQGPVYNGVQALLEENGHLFVRAGNLNHRVLRHPTQPQRILGFKAYRGAEDTDSELQQATAFNLMYRFVWSAANQGFIQLSAGHGVQEATWIAASAVAFDNVYRGGRQGLDIYPLQLARHQLPPPALMLYQLSMFNQPVLPGPDSLLSQALSQTKQLTFNHLQDMFSLHFSAPDFLQPQQLEYRYRLEGFDRDWLGISANNRVATYTRLPAGNYQFQLSARYLGGVWQPPLTLQVSVLPPWWLSWWFLSLSVALTLAAVGGVIFWRFDNERCHRQQLEREVLARTEEIKTQHQALQDSYAELKTAQQQLVTQEKMASLGALVAGVAHEINTPLGICVTATSHLHNELELLNSSYQQGGIQKSQFERFLQQFSDGLKILHSNTHRAADLVQSFKQVSVDQSSDSVRDIELVAYLRDVLLSLQPKLRQIGCSVELDTPDTLTMHTDAGAIAQIITNLVVNSLHHGLQATAAPKISIVLHLVEGQLQLLFYDNGCGMNEADLARLFDPFFTTKRHQGGTGLGSHIVYNLVTVRLKGQITVSSPPGLGLQYFIRLPLNIYADRNS